MRSIVLCVAVSLLTACHPSEASQASTTATAPQAIPAEGTLAQNATLVRVIDGDTIVVSIHGHDEKVRLLGIDTPETVKPNTAVQCFGPEASKLTKSLLPPGTALHLERDAEARDDYGRLLAYVYRVSDGLFVNLSIVEHGDARLLTFPTNTTHATEFVAAAREAEQADLGLWLACRG
jgi:micrococcal nuclease